MKRLFLSIIFLILFAIPAFSQNIKIAGIASKGGKIVRTSANVQHTLMETYPSCTITVYLTGTLTLASIFSDEIGTPKSNPFLANSDASWSFYVGVGRYDIKFSGTGILNPFTLSDVFVEAGGGGGGGSGVITFEGRDGTVVSAFGDYSWNEIDKSTSSLADITTRSASDLNSGILPDAQFPATLPAISGVNLTNLNATNINNGTLDDARLSSNIPKKNAINTFTQENYFMANTGINTTTPRRKLDILDGTGAQLRLSAVDNSVYTDLFVDSGGTLNILPTGNVVFDATGNQVNPLNNFDQNLGQINKKWLSIHAAELFVETLVAQNTIATIGGRILVAPTNQLIADLSPASATINVKYNNLFNGDRVYMEANNSVEFFAITSGATVIPGGFSYTVTRNLDGTGANQWFAGDAMLNTGVAGNGFIDLYSIRGVKSATQLGPTIVGNVRNSSTFNDWTERWAIGNLNGIFGYGTDTYGAAFGVPTGPWIKIDPTNGVRIGFNTTTKTQIDAAGNATFSGTITAPAGNIGNWTINSTSLNNGVTYLAAGFDVPVSGEVAWFGKAVSNGAFEGLTIRDTTGKSISIVVGQNLGSGDIYPYFHAHDGVHSRIVIGGLNHTFESDGSTNSMGMKIWDSTGSKLVEFSDIQNKISILNIAPTKVYIGTGNFNSTDTSFYVDSAGQFSLKDKLSWNGTTLTINGNGAFSGDLTGTNMSLTGKLSLSGVSSAITIGTTPPSSSSVGTGIWLDRTGLYGLASNIVQVKLDAATGSILAGASNVTLDADGIKLLADDISGTNLAKVVKWTNGSDRVLTISGQSSSTLVSGLISARQRSGVTTGSTNITLRVDNDLGLVDRNLQLYYYDNGHATLSNKAVAQFGGFGGASGGVIISNFSTPLTPVSSAVLELRTTQGALLFSRLTTTERDALTPTDAMVIYNLTTNKLQVRAAGVWVDLH